MLVFEKGWVDRLAPAEKRHKLNTESAIRGLFSSVKLERGDRAKADIVLGMVRSNAVKVFVYKGVHQSKFGSKNVVDQSRIDQGHFNLRIQGVAYHVYVQPNLRGTYDITEISSVDRSVLEGVLAGSGAFD